MADVRVAVTVSQDGQVLAQRLDDQRSTSWRIGYKGLDKDLIRLFERWLTLRDRVWQEVEIRVFGSLLHRCLFGEENWAWLQTIIDDATRVRLELSFPDDSRLAAIPWEFLYRPDTDTRRGAFLATERNLVLSRYIPQAGRRGQFSAQDTLTVLVVVSQPEDPRIGPVEYETVLDTIDATSATLGFTTLKPLHNPTERDLANAIRSGAPDLVHFMGHGEFDETRGAAALALVDPDGGADWVDDRRIAGIVSRGDKIPRAVVLHSCDAGKADYEASFAGVAPQLIRHGVQAVIAMQYPVRNSAATAFSSGLYEALAAGDDIDTAAQEARFQISGTDPRLLGVPVVYLQSKTALLRSRTDDA
ncbi:MAG: CHAT domain-containing protein [Actinophytocola sp.]|uniref:CHAT domain-containing protein n=1 Tax=Actinophytocola sp. TaxID=1872138 RepID=UPI003C752655